ncbi:LuxR C-terminal-related transcriptional regulator [Pseudomonas sp. GX19020]|uniref:LuxR C-terminal-related transcriptional regulator n=1 Tax=Pseudomonas sp. GX19020 TaxID=2942277 RepID=UPI00201981A4|nr:LuxR C-terminal-related transcriptional regulator [Pseudomonas sp. GX19020]MCL4068819.1 LuxR C-terminal-related transcriptional regulator [Pseudomonas sp. GX19020]
MISTEPGQEPLAAQPFLPREALVGLILRAAAPLIVLCAPAGSGKSMTLLALAQALRARSLDCHWTAAANLADAPHDGTLLLDPGTWSIDLLKGIGARLRRQRIVIALNGPLPQPLRDAWIAGRACLISGSDLAFTPQEAAVLFGQTQIQIQPSRETQLLHQFTRGWPLGLGLLSRETGRAFALMRRDGISQPLPSSLSLWFDDWMQASLTRQERALLMDLSVFGDFPASLLAALPAAARPEDAGAPCLSRHLVEDGLFLHQSETRPGWFSLMPAFARHLRNRLDLFHPERATQIRHFAVRWSAQNHDPDGEIRHGLAIWSDEEAMSRVDAAGAVVVSLAQGPDLALAQPILAASVLTRPLTFFGMIYERIRLGAFDEAQVHFENAASLTDGFTRFETSQDMRQIRSWVDVFTAVIRISADMPVDPAWRAGFGPALRDAISSDPVLAMAQSTVSMLMALNAGDCEEALSISRLAMQVQARSRADKAAIFVCLHHASALMARARLTEAKAAVAEAGKLAADHTLADSYEMVSCQIHAGLCAFEMAEPAQAMALLEPCYGHLAAIHGWRRNWLEYFAALAELAFQAKGYRAAELWITRGSDFASQRKQPRLALGLDLVRADLLHRAGQVGAARQQFDAIAADLPEAREAAPQLSDLAALLEAEVLLSEGRPEDAARLLQNLDRTAIAAADLRLDLRLTGLTLELARLAADSDAMILALRKISVTAPNLPRLVGLPQIQKRLRQALDKLSAQKIALDPRVQSDLAALIPGGRALLSPRERQIVSLIVEGLSTKEIARALGTSDGTVKTHRKNLYEKLNVRSRSKAIARAKNLGLHQGQD